MADRPPPPPSRAPPAIPRKPLPVGASQQTQSSSKKEMTTSFRRALSTKRMNRLSRSASPAPVRDSYAEDFVDFAPPPAYSSLKNLPLIPTAPTDPRSIRFKHLLHTLSNNPINWENPGLLDEALSQVPLDRIYAQAEEESQIFQVQAESLGPNHKPDWAYQDCTVKALLDWFKGTFFSWVNNPPCSTCGSPTVAVGVAAPIEEEKVRGANSVELYQCSLGSCSRYERFPRYTDPFVLMTTRKGRVGEWAACFGMLCRAISARVRWVWNSEDHVWIEYYSTHKRRWIHLDPVEGWFDKPMNYTRGWGRKLGYCIAFSRDGATDVTRRYVRNFNKYGAERSKCPEAVLVYILDEIRAMRRKDLPKQERFSLKGEDMRENLELSSHVASSLVTELCRALEKTDISAESRKAAEARQDAAVANTSTTSESTSRQSPR